MLLWLPILALICGGCTAVPESAAEVLPVRVEAGPLTVQPWNWFDSPVLALGEDFHLGFTVRNTTAEPLDYAAFWLASRLVITAPDKAETVLDGDRLTALFELPAFLAAGDVTTEVLQLADCYSFTALGDYRLTWTTPLGELGYTLSVLPEADYLLYRLAHDEVMNGFELYLYGEDGLIYPGSLAGRLAALGPEIIPRLIPFLDDDRPCLIEGSEEATLGSMYNHRVMDYAAMIIAQLRHESYPELQARTPAERDPAIARLRAALAGE